MWFYLHPLIHLFNFTTVPKKQVLLCHWKTTQGHSGHSSSRRTHWTAPLDFSWVKSEKRINSPGQETSLAEYGKSTILYHSHQYDWELFISQITTQTSLAFLQTGQQSINKKNRLEQTWQCRSRAAWDPGVESSKGVVLPLAFVGVSAPFRAPGLSDLGCDQVTRTRCSWRSLLLQQILSSFIHRQLQQCDSGPCRQYPINNLHMKYINQPSICCIRKFKVKLGDRQWLLVKYVNAT